MATKKDGKRSYGGSGNREYKSDVIFMMLQIPEYALNVYNAMNNSDYTDPDLVEIILLENGISLSIRNDASFCISNYLNLYEHQPSYSPNAPLRFLIYLTGLLRKIIAKRDLYGRKLVQIETPHFAIFYNGTEKRPEREALKLSDTFINKTDQPEKETRKMLDIQENLDIHENLSKEVCKMCQNTKKLLHFSTFSVILT